MRMLRMEEVLDGSPAADFYREHGWYVAPVRISEQLLADARRGLDDHWAGHRDNVVEGAKLRFADWMPGDGEGTRNNEYLSLQNARVNALVHAPAIGSVACQAGALAGVRLFDDQMVFKPGGQSGSAVGWHVDGDYWQTCSSNDMLTAWVPLHDCPQEMGPLVVLDGSHRWSHKIDRSAFSFHQTNMEELEQYIIAAGFEFKPVILELKRGEFSLHHCRTIHGSFPNRAVEPRIALAVHMQDTSNQYRAAFRPDGRPIHLFNDSICQKTAAGLPDYSDDRIFPKLWDNTNPGASEGGLSE